MAFLLLVVSYTMLSFLFYAVLYRTIRAELPNGVYLNRAHPFSDLIVLREPRGHIVARDVAHVLFSYGYVAGGRYVTPDSTDRFIYRLGDSAAVLDRPGEDDRFDEMLADSGLAADWPWGPEDPTWLDWRRLLLDDRYKRFWYE